MNQLYKEPNCLFIKHKTWDIKENERFLGLTLYNQKEAEKMLKSLQYKNPEFSYSIVFLGKNVNELKMRIVNFLEKLCLPKYGIKINGEIIPKTFLYEETAESAIETLKTKNPNVDYQIVKIKECCQFPEYISLDNRDYDLLKKDGKVSEKNSVFGMNIIVRENISKAKKGLKWQN